MCVWGESDRAGERRQGMLHVCVDVRPIWRRSRAGYISPCHSPEWRTGPHTHHIANPSSSRPQTSYYSPVSESDATYLQCSQGEERYKGSGKKYAIGWRSLAKIDSSMCYSYCKANNITACTLQAFLSMSVFFRESSAISCTNVALNLGEVFQ